LKQTNKHALTKQQKKEEKKKKKQTVSAWNMKELRKENFLLDKTDVSGSFCFGG